MHFLSPGQRLELAPVDAERLGVRQGDRVAVSSNGHSVEAVVAVRERMRPGSGFLIEGLATNNPNVLATGGRVEVERIEEPALSVVVGGTGREAGDSAR